MILSIIISLIAICTVVIAFIPEGKILDKSKIGLRQITHIGRWKLFLGFLLIVLPIAQYFIQTAKDENKEVQTEKEIKRRDSLSKFDNDRRDSTNRVAYRASIEQMSMDKRISDSNIFRMLLKSGYHADSINKALGRTLDKIKDSAKTKVIEGSQPSLILTPGHELSYDSSNSQFTFYTYSISSLGAASTGYNLSSSLMIYNAVKGYVYVGKTPFLSPSFAIFKDGQFSAGLHLDVNLHPEMIYLWIRGNYKNQDGSKTFPINYLYAFDCNKKKTTIFSQESDKEKITKLMESYE